MVLKLQSVILFIYFPVIFGAPGEIANQKCIEYSQIPSQLSPYGCPRSPVPLIIGGTPTSLMGFPHMAAIGFGYTADGEITWQCGGSLISEKFVLTAAHCLKSRDKGPAQKVRFGDNTDNYDYINNEISSYREYYIINRIQHPDYKPPLKYNDIALLELHKPVQFSMDIRPACLETNYYNIPQTVIATGYGKQTYEFLGKYQLMKVELPVLSSDHCTRSFASDIRRPRSVLKDGIIDSQMCVGDLSGHKDTCQGDSGGPIQVPLQWSPCTYKVIGVTSFGKFCGYPNAPSIYTRVSSYIDWIEQVVWGNQLKYQFK
ncbi:serine protease snake-like [Ctenocephalides felis]|uniref:serine protease snake-like n=1 Tax=Ctenocephalides felis TaxID=7515 RepID=UPI000E6E3DCE|nr:serine protease snake-like [Ctenocephalides felis]